MGRAEWAAAIELCRYGVQVTVVDERPVAGRAEFTRQLAKEFTAENERLSLGGSTYVKGKRLIEEFRKIGGQCVFY